MAKAKLIFNLDDFDDQMAHKRCVKSLDLVSALHEFSSNRKKTLEYRLDDSPMDIDRYEVLEMVFGEFYRVLEEYSIDIDELIS